MWASPHLLKFTIYFVGLGTGQNVRGGGGGGPEHGEK